MAEATAPPEDPEEHLPNFLECPSQNVAGWRPRHDIAAATPPPEDPEEHLPSFLECPICYVSYDNIFKTPLLLPCSHTFCMECLSRLCLFLKKSQDFPCPLCRCLAQIPPEGVPKMQPNLEVIARLPKDTQVLQDVWADGYKLCWMKKSDSSEGKGSLVTLHLLSNSGENRPGPEGLVSIEQTGCRVFCRSVWGIGVTILTLGICLFTVLFLAIFLNNRS